MRELLDPVGDVAADRRAGPRVRTSPMRLRARLVATLAVTACTGAPADAGAPAQPPRPQPAAPATPSAPAAPGKVTPVTTLFIASPRPTGEVAPPWSLTASDGSGLLLTRID